MIPANHAAPAAAATTRNTTTPIAALLFGAGGATCRPEPIGDPIGCCEIGATDGGATEGGGTDGGIGSASSSAERFPSPMSAGNEARTGSYAPCGRFSAIAISFAQFVGSMN